MRMYFVEPEVAVYNRASDTSKLAFYVPLTGWFVDVIERRKDMTYLHFGSSSGWVKGSPLTPVQFDDKVNPYDPARYKSWNSEDGTCTVLDDLKALYSGHVLYRGDYAIHKVTTLGMWSVDDRFWSPTAYSAFASRNRDRMSQWIGT